MEHTTFQEEAGEYIIILWKENDQNYERDTGK